MDLRRIARKTSRRTFLQSVGAYALALGALKTLGRAEPVELLFWNSPLGDPRYAQKYLPWFMEKLRQLFPGVTVAFGTFSYGELQNKFLIQGRTGKPDVIEALLEQVPIYQKAELLAPLTKRFNDWPESQHFEKVALDPLINKGELWGIPYVVNARGLIYRKSLLNKYDLTVPKSWNELIEAAQQISAKEKGDSSGYIVTTKRGAARGFQEFLSHLYQLSERVFVFNNASRKWEVRVTPTQLAQIFQFYHDLFFKGDPSAIPQNLRGKNGLELDQGYSLGKHALAPNGSFILGRRQEGDLQRKILEDDTGVAPLPIPARGGKPRTYLEVKSVLLNAFSKYQDLAFEVVKIFTSAESIARLQALGGDTSPRRDIVPYQIELDTVAFRWLQQWKEILPSGVALEPVNWILVQQEISELIEAVVYNAITPQDSAQRLYQRMVDEAAGFS
jgi:ABC-type glycerol-3-phosphate transport system substrate-binding protein